MEHPDKVDKYEHAEITKKIIHALRIRSYILLTVKIALLSSALVLVIFSFKNFDKNFELGGDILTAHLIINALSLSLIYFFLLEVTEIVAEINKKIADYKQLHKRLL